jgi:hypothetical protein
LKTVFIILLSLIALPAWGTPDKVEFIFLSMEKMALLDEALEKQDAVHLAKVAELDCIPMGDGCFNPQSGFTETDKKEIQEKKPLKLQKPKDEIKIKTFNSLDTSLINCDKNYYFDMFCGKAKGSVANGGEVEIWVDTSSSLRKMDYSKQPNYCKRRAFVKKAVEGCKGKVSVSVFNTTLKGMGDLSNICLNYGANDTDNIIEWVKQSKAKYLLVVTDIDELNGKLSEFLDEVGAKLHGTEVTDFTVSDLVKFTNTFIKTCKAVKK